MPRVLESALGSLNFHLGAVESHWRIPNFAKQRNAHDDTFLRKPERGLGLEKQGTLFTLEPGLICIWVVEIYKGIFATSTWAAP